MNLPGTTLVKIWTRSPAWPTKATRHGEHRCHGSRSFRLRGPLRIHAAGPAAAPVRVLRGSVMVRPSPRRLSPRNKQEIGALSAVWDREIGAYPAGTPRPYCRQTSGWWGRPTLADRRLVATVSRRARLRP